MLLTDSVFFMETTTTIFPCFHTTYYLFLEVNAHEDSEGVGEYTPKEKKGK
jgi:hypothetical protein